MRVTLSMIVLAVAVPVIAGADQAPGVTACPTPATASQCGKPAKAPAKAVPKAKSPAPAVINVIATTEPVTTPGSWKSALDPLPAGGWVLISDGPLDNPSVVYASTHNVHHDGNVVTAWIRWEYSRIQADIYPLHYQSAVTREELDCDARSYRRAAVFYYRRNNLEDKALQFTALNDDTTWKLAIPGTEADAMLNWACTPPAVHHAAPKASDQQSDRSDDRVDAKKDAKADPKAKTASTSGAAAAVTSSAPSSAPAATGGINLHTNR